MNEKELFSNFWKNETETTRKVLSRIPEGSDYRPDPASRTAQEIAWQIVCEETMIVGAAESGKAEWAPPPMPATMKEVLAAYDKNSREIVQRWATLPENRWNGTLEFFGSSERCRRWPGVFFSILFITGGRSRRTCDPWGPRCLRFTAPVTTSRSEYSNTRIVE